MTEIDCGLSECKRRDVHGVCTALNIELTVDPESGFLDCTEYEINRSDETREG